jgi:hypothetical protein
MSPQITQEIFNIEIGHMSTKAENRSSLKEIARRAMIERGLDPDFSPSALRQLDSIQKAAEPHYPLGQGFAFAPKTLQNRQNSGSAA